MLNIVAQTAQNGRCLFYGKSKPYLHITNKILKTTYLRGCETTNN